MSSENFKVNVENDSSQFMDLDADEVESVDVDDKGKKKAKEGKRRRERSPVWKYMTKLKTSSIPEKHHCKCNKCGLLFTYDSKQGTGNLNRHVASCNEFKDVERVLHSTFNEYAGDGTTTTSNVTSSSNTSKVTDEMDDSTGAYGVKARLKAFNQFQSKDFDTNKKSEMQLYLEESRIDRNSEMDVLVFWKANEFRYPVLAKMARDFLTIPITTVALESTFSAAGRVLNEHRSSLSKDATEALICTKDWLFADSFVDSNENKDDELTEVITFESEASNSVNNPNS